MEGGKVASFVLNTLLYPLKKYPIKKYSKITEFIICILVLLNISFSRENSLLCCEQIKGWILHKDCDLFDQNENTNNKKKEETNSPSCTFKIFYPVVLSFYLGAYLSGSLLSVEFSVVAQGTHRLTFYCGCQTLLECPSGSCEGVESWVWRPKSLRLPSPCLDQVVLLS